MRAYGGLVGVTHHAGRGGGGVEPVLGWAVAHAYEHA